jgi:hypothetical protein
MSPWKLFLSSFFQVCVTMVHPNNEFGEAVGCECYEINGIPVFDEA